MKLLTNKQFGTMKIDVYKKDDEFYMSRKQINDALEYADDKSFARVIRANRDIIGQGIVETVIQEEGKRLVSRNIEFFSFLQIFQMLRFSKQPKANKFMEFTALTMKQLIEGKAQLKFNTKESEIEYLSNVRKLFSKFKLFGIAKNEAALIIQECEMNNIDPQLILIDKIKDRKERDRLIQRGRINVRIQKVGKILTELYPNISPDKCYRKTWHMYATEMRMHLGFSKDWIKRHSEDKIKYGSKAPSYLDYTEEIDAYPEGLVVAKYLLKKHEKMLIKAGKATEAF